MDDIKYSPQDIYKVLNLLEYKTPKQISAIVELNTRQIKKIKYIQKNGVNNDLELLTTCGHSISNIEYDIKSRKKIQKKKRKRIIRVTSKHFEA